MHDHNLRKRKPVEAVVPKKVVKRAKKQVSSNMSDPHYHHTVDQMLTSTPAQAAKEVKPLSPFIVLPLELLQDILEQLPDAAYMAMKFVCRSFHAATLSANGREVVDLKAKARAEVAEYMRGWVKPPYSHYMNPWYDPRSQVEASRMSNNRISYQCVLTGLEASYPGTLLLLTCVLCGNRKAHGQFGFCDTQFNQTLFYRRCLDCRNSADFGYMRRGKGYPSKVKINGIAVMRCGSCRRICPVSRRTTRTGAAIPQHRCGQDLGLLK